LFASLRKRYCQKIGKGIYVLIVWSKFILLTRVNVKLHLPPHRSIQWATPIIDVSYATESCRDLMAELYTTGFISLNAKAQLENILLKQWEHQSVHIACTSKDESLQLWCLQWFLGDNTNLLLKGERACEENTMLPFFLLIFHVNYKYTR
jgi:hypothetical protein